LHQLYCITKFYFDFSIKTDLNFVSKYFLREKALEISRFNRIAKKIKISKNVEDISRKICDKNYECIELGCQKFGWNFPENEFDIRGKI
jgi:hypothetical protein